LFRSFAISAALALVLVAFAPAGPALARPHPTPTPTATPAPGPEDPAITQIARREFVAWQAGVIDKSRYADVTSTKMLPDKVADTSRALSALGALQHTEWLGPLALPADSPPGVKGYLYRMTCSNAAVYEQLTMAPDGKIDGIFFGDKLP
jgi:hypothetical protein